MPKTIAQINKKTLVGLRQWAETMHFKGQSNYFVYREDEGYRLGRAPSSKDHFSRLICVGGTSLN